MTLFELQATLGLDKSQFDEAIKDAKADGKKLGIDLGKAYDTSTESAKQYGDEASLAEQVTQDLFGSYTSASLLSSAIKSVAIEIKELAKQSIQLSSDLQEVQNVTDATFAESSNIVDLWAKRAIQSYGISELSAKKYAGTIGAMFKSAGYAGEDLYELSTQVVGLSADLASFYNLDVDTAFGKLQSALSGQVMPLRELGVDLTEASLEEYMLANSMYDSIESMSNQEKMLLRLQYIMSATTDAQGDFARTSGSAANQVKLFGANMEQLLSGADVSSLATLVGFGNTFLSLFTEKYTILDGIEELQKKGASDSEKYAMLMAEETRIAQEKAQADKAAAEYQKALNEVREQGEPIAKAYGLTYEEYVKAITGEETATKDNITLMNELTSARVSASEEMRDADTAFRKIIEDYSDLSINALSAQRVYERDSELFEQAAEKVEGYTEYVENLSRVNEKLGEINGIKIKAESLNESISALKEYSENVHLAMAEAVESVINGFERMEVGSDTSISDMTSSLQSQSEYMETYAENLKTAMEKGVDEGIIQQLSDGSTQSAEYLNAIVSGSEEEIAALNEAWSNAQIDKVGFTDALSEMSLEADSEYQNMLEDAESRANEINSALEGIGEGVSEIVSTNMSSAVSEVNSKLSTAYSSAVSYVSLINSALSNLGGVSSGGTGKGEHETGFNYVPYNNYATTLDEGEMVLTKSQAAEYRKGNRSIGGAEIDYNRLAETMVRALGSVGINIDGKRAGRLMQKQNMIAQNAYNRSIAQGVGL